MQNKTDESLVKEVLEGNKNQFRLIVEKYQDAIFRVCLGYTHNEDDANDLTQETFISAYKHLKSFKFNAAFQTWLYRIAINSGLNYQRHKKKFFTDRLEDIFNRSATNLSDFDITANNPEEILINNEHTEIIQKEISKLSDKQQTAFVFSKYEKLPQKEIAAIMNLSEGAVEQLLQRAKANLQKRLSKYFRKN